MANVKHAKCRCKLQLPALLSPPCAHAPRTAQGMQPPCHVLSAWVQDACG